MRIERFINFTRLNDVEQFTNLAVRHRCHITVKFDQSVVDGKSMMGIVSLIVYQPLTVVAEGDDASEFVQKLDEIISY